MRIMTSYKVKIKHYNHIFRDTVEQYRKAVRFFLEVCDARWTELSMLTGKGRNNWMERLTIQTAKNPSPEYNFSREFYKFPCYLGLAGDRPKEIRCGLHRAPLRRAQGMCTHPSEVREAVVPSLRFPGRTGTPYETGLGAADPVR